MRHVRFGNTGLQVSQLCLGTMTFGNQCDEATSNAILNRAAEGGITFLDTADVYPFGAGLECVGRTEEILGRWLRGRRQDYIVMTKGSGPMGTRPWQRGNSRKHVMDAIDSSLRRLGTDYIDIYLLHQPDPDTPIEESVRTMNDLVTAGKIRYGGCSNFPADQVARALCIAEAKNFVRFDGVQSRYNLLFRELERDLLALCRDQRLAFMPYNPLAGGLLSGKQSREGGPLEGTRFAVGDSGKRYRDRYWHDREFAIIEALRPLARKAGLPMAGLAMAWLIAQPVVTAPVVGVSRPEQLDDAFLAVDIPIDPDLLEQIDAISLGK
jgi:aryl-alcohol dehydrogenase (NADP+)